MIIKHIIDIIRSNEPANRENVHSFIVACRTNVELVKFAIEYKQSTAIDTLNKINFFIKKRPNFTPKKNIFDKNFLSKIDVTFNDWCKNNSVKIQHHEMVKNT